jgi:uncharacterized membrane protein
MFWLLYFVCKNFAEYGSNEPGLLEICVLAGMQWRILLPITLGGLPVLLCFCNSVWGRDEYGIGVSFFFFVSVAGAIVLAIRWLEYRSKDRWLRLFFTGMLLASLYAMHLARPWG